MTIDDYYREKSYERFLNNEIKHITKGKYSRTNDGVFCNREVHSFATKNTQCCHPIVSV